MSLGARSVLVHLGKGTSAIEERGGLLGGETAGDARSVARFRCLVAVAARSRETTTPTTV